MAKIKGVWKFNEVVKIIKIAQDVNFSCGDTAGQTKVSVITDNNRIMIQPSFTNVYFSSSGWSSAKNRVWDFGENEQEVSDEFAAWVLQNANGGKVVFPATDGNIAVLVKENGTTTLATAGTYCESDIDVNVDVPTGSDANIQPLTITENGTYYASDDVQGYAPILVDVPTSDSGAAKLKAIVDKSITEITEDDLEGVTKIGDHIFDRCTALTSITLPNSITNIGSYAFCNCIRVTSITVPNGVQDIKNNTFRGCSALTSITLPNSVANICASAFYGCSALTSITLPNSVANIYASAFYGCTALTSITLPNSVTTIINNAFTNCTNLTTINYNYTGE